MMSTAMVTAEYTRGHDGEVTLMIIDRIDDNWDNTPIFIGMAEQITKDVKPTFTKTDVYTFTVYVTATAQEDKGGSLELASVEYTVEFIKELTESEVKRAFPR